MYITEDTSYILFTLINIQEMILQTGAQGVV